MISWLSSSSSEIFTSFFTVWFNSNFLVSGWNVLSSCLVSLWDVYVYEMLHSKLVISSLHEFCIFWISFCQPFLTPHHYFLFNHPTTWLVLTVPYSVQFGLCCLNLCQWGHCWSAVKTADLHCNLQLQYLSLSTVKAGQSILETYLPLLLSSSQELLTESLARPLYLLFSPSLLSLLVSFCAFYLIRCALTKGDGGA